MARRLALGALLLLQLRAALAEELEEVWCDWVEVDEWPALGSHCPALPDGGNVTICCWSCCCCCCPADWWLPQEDDEGDPEECPGRDKPAAASGAATHDNLFSLLGLAAVILLLLLWLWMCHKERSWFHGEDSDAFSSTPTFALNTYSQLQSRDSPPSYGACSAAARQLSSLVDPLCPEGLPRPHRDTPVQFHQAASGMPKDEDDVLSFSPPRDPQGTAVLVAPLTFAS